MEGTERVALSIGAHKTQQYGCIILYAVYTYLIQGWVIRHVTKLDTRAHLHQQASHLVLLGWDT